MPKPRINLDEAVLFAACKDGITVTRLLGVFGGVMDRETLRMRIKEYVAAGKLVWTKQGSRGQAGILKTV